MKLYRVTIEHTFFMASNKEPKHADVQKAARQALREESIDLHVTVEVTRQEEIRQEYRDSVPYGELSDGRTCAQWLESTATS